MKKIFILCICIIALIGCSNNEIKESSKTNKIEETSESEKQSNYSNASSNFTDNSTSSNSILESIASSTSSVPSNYSNSENFSNSSTASIESSTTLNDETNEENLIEGLLYGDNNFINKMRTLDERYVLPNNTLYISLDGNDSNTGNINNPLKSINKGIEKAYQNINLGLAGVVCVRGGYYQENVTFNNYSGVEDNYLVLTTYQDEVVKIGGTKEAENVDFTMSNYIIMEGFIICDNLKAEDPVAVRMDQANHHIVFKNNIITNVKVTSDVKKGEPCGFLIYMNGTLTAKSHNNVLFYQNEIYDCETGWSEAIEVVGNCEYINIIDNVVYDTGNIGIDVGGNFGYCADKSLDQARYVVIRGNDVSKCYSGYGDTSYAIYVDGARDVVIEGNKAYLSMGGIEVGSEVAVSGYLVKNIIVRNNLVYDNDENGITIGGYSSSSKVGVVENVKIYNNTIVNNTINNKDADCNGQLTVSKVDGLHIFNNIFYSSKNDYALIGGFLKEDYCKNVVFKNNIYYAGDDQNDIYFEIYSNGYESFASFSKKVNENGRYGDPLFVDISNNNFKLTKNSIAINQGYNDLEMCNFDLDKKSRFIGIIDCGCYEYFY